MLFNVQIWCNVWSNFLSFLHTFEEDLKRQIQDPRNIKHLKSEFQRLNQAGLN